MKLIHTVNVAAIACLSFSPAALAVLGTSCLGAIDAISKFPGPLIQQLQSQTCEAGCQPVISQWNTPVKQEILDALMEDGIRHTGIEDPAAQKKFAESIDDVFEEITSDCREKLENKHLCHDPDSVRPFVDCINRNARTAVIRGMSGLVPYLSEKRCKAVADYFKSDQLWQEDLPEHLEAYVDQCHDL